MRADWREADRSRHLHAALGAWREQGLLDQAQLAAAEKLFPPGKADLAVWWRLLAFLFVIVGAGALMGFVGLVLDVSDSAPLLIIFGLVMAAVTEAAMRYTRGSSTGIVGATSLLSVVLVTAGFASGLPHDWPYRYSEQAVLTVLTILLGLAAWRWGLALYAGAAFFCCLATSASLGTGETVIFIFGVAGGWWGLRAAEINRKVGLTPAHREGLLLVSTVGLFSAYLAINYYGVDHHLLLEAFDRGISRHAAAPPGSFRLVSLSATVFYPLALLAWGMVGRKRVPLDVGIVTIALSLVTLRFYVHLAPLWVILVFAGGALLGVALALIRYLVAGTGGERHGFTATVLSDERRKEELLALSATLTQTPAARVLPPQELRGGGGAFGGGGASGSFN